MLCLIISKIYILHMLVVLVISANSCARKIEQCAYTAVSIPYAFHRYSIKSKFAPWFQTAGFGVFAGRPFERDVLVPVTTRTLFLPDNIPKNQILYNYVFGYNETHMGLFLDYGSLLNHHESANTKAGVKVRGSNNVYFQVRMGF